MRVNKAVIILNAFGIWLLFSCSTMKDNVPLEFSQAVQAIEKADEADVENTFPHTMKRAVTAVNEAKQLYSDATAYIDPQSVADKRRDALKKADEAKLLATNALLAKQEVTAWDANIETFTSRDNMAQSLKQVSSQLEEASVAHRHMDIDVTMPPPQKNIQQSTADENLNLSKTVAYFQTGQSNLDSLALKEVEDVAQILRKNSQLSARIVAFADPRGSLTFNQKLAKKRALSVAQALKASGISEDRFQMQVVGEAGGPAGKDLASLQLQRKVEIFFSPAIAKTTGASGEEERKITENTEKDHEATSTAR